MLQCCDFERHPLPFRHICQEVPQRQRLVFFAVGISKQHSVAGDTMPSASEMNVALTLNLPLLSVQVRGSWP